MIYADCTYPGCQQRAAMFLAHQTDALDDYDCACYGHLDKLLRPGIRTDLTMLDEFGQLVADINEEQMLENLSEETLPAEEEN